MEKKATGVQDFRVSVKILLRMYVARNFCGEERKTLDLRIILSILKQHNF